MRLNTKPRAANDTKIRWYDPRDERGVLAVEQWCFAPLTRHTLDIALRSPHAVPMVAERGGEIVGHLIFQIFPTTVHVQRLAVDPSHRGEGVGTLLIERAKSKLGGLRQRRTRAVCVLHERMAAGQMFLRSQGFRFVDQSPCPCGCGEALYRFEFRLGREWT